MPDRLGEIESRIELLAEQLSDVRARLARLEQPSVAEGTSAAAVPSGDVEHAGSKGWAALPATAGLVGRTLVVLGGGYLIRAVTDADLVPSGAGVALGLAYAAWWMLRADVAARSGDRPSAFFHALASGLMALPLLWETTAHFGLLGPRSALLLLVAYLAGSLVVARRRALDVAAALLTLMALATAVALLASTHDLLATACALLTIAFGVEALAPRGRWAPLRWATALTLDVVTVAMVALVARPGGLPEGYVAITAPAAFVAALALPTVYLGSLAVRTLLHERQVSAFEMTQVPLALLVGFGGAWHLTATQALSRAGVGLGAAIVVLGVLCYAAAFLFAERRPAHAPNFYFYGTAAGVLTLVGTGALLGGTQLVLAGWGLAAVAALAGQRLERTTLALHGALYLLATALLTGFVDGSIRAVLAAAAPAGAGWRLAPPFVLVGLAVYAVVAMTRATRPAGWWSRLPQLLTALVTILGIAGVLTAAAIGGLGRLPRAGVGMEAMAGTAVLALLAIAAAWVGARWTLPELGWVVHPLLVLGGLKLVAMDLRQGGPTALFLSFVVYGAALSVAPRLLRARAPAGEAPPRPRLN